MTFIQRALSGVPRLTVALLIMAGAGAGLFYYRLFIVHQREYLETRNFRALQGLATLIDTAVENEAQVIRNLARNPDQETWKQRKERYADGDLPKALPWLPHAKVSYGLKVEGRRSYIEMHLSDATKQGLTSNPVQIPLPSVLEPVFKTNVPQSTFDTLALAAPDGATWFAMGAHAQELRSTRLEAAQLAARTTPVDLLIGGTPFKLFAQPCCAYTENSPPMLVIGLVEARPFEAESWAISTSVVKLAMLTIALALLAWPFMRLACVGACARMRAFEVFQIAVSSVAILALVATIVLDAYAYQRLTSDADRHLAILARQLQSNFRSEIRDAFRQLSNLEQLPAVKDRVSGDVLTQPIEWPYPFFSTFARIDAEGMQQDKLATAHAAPSLFSVAKRRYFQDARDNKLTFDRDVCPTGCVLESNRSWTSGEPQAVLSKRAASNNGDVLALSIPMRSLIRPILPPGYRFAVIDQTGKVWFHSDWQRNGSENFFLETDDTRRLRAEIIAHSSEWLHLRYSGAPYRAYVKPIEPFGLFVITLFETEDLWALNREWMIVAVSFLALYLMLWSIALRATLGRDTTMVWPDPARQMRYLAVSVICVVALLVTCGVAMRVHGAALLWWAYGIPLAAWAATYVLLRRRPSRVARSRSGSREPALAHAMATMLFLVVSGGVPGVLVFLGSFQLHAQAYIKRSDFRLVAALAERDERLSAEYTDKRGLGRSAVLARIHAETTETTAAATAATSATSATTAASAATSPAPTPALDRYYSFFYGTTIEPCEARETNETGEASETGETSGDFFIGLLEDYLPYYAEASVEWRELLHERAGDASWHSQIEDSGTLMLRTIKARHEAVLRSHLPTLTGSRFRPRDAGAVTLADTAGALLSLGNGAVVGFVLLLMVAASWMVAFISRHLFMTGATDSLRSSARLTATAIVSEPLFVLCDAGIKARSLLGASPLSLEEIVRAGDPETALADALRTLAREEPMGALLVSDLDTDVDDVDRLNRKLALIEILAADRARPLVVLCERGPAALAAAASAAAKADGSGGCDTDLEDRWNRVLGTFLLIDWRERESEPEPASTSRQTGLARLLATEGAAHVTVQRICDRLRSSAAIRDGLLTREQVADEIAQQAAPLYRRLWASCSDEEKLVLAHVARDGWVKASAHGVVRRLLGRRLLRKDPALRVMNGTFGSFVLSPACSADIDRLEASSHPSAWERFRFPLIALVTAAAIFLFATQRELYDKILSLTTAAPVLVPAVIRTVGLFAGRRLMDDAGLKG